MFTPGMVFAFRPPPIVGMNDDAGPRRIGVILVDMPAVAVFVADDPRGCA
jgi:hypothetical protein